MTISSVTQNNITLEAMDATWGRGHCRKITFVADVADSLNGDYFDLNAIGADMQTETKYYVLFDSGAAVDPAPAGKTKIEVSYTTNDSAEVIADAFKAALVTNGLFFTTDNADASVSVENWYPGPITTEVTANAAAFTYVIEQVGFGGYLGKTKEGISLAMEVQNFDVTANQTGGIVLDQIFQGANATVTMSLLQLSTERWESIIGGVVGAINEAGSTNVVGLGESRLFSSMSSLSGRLVLHPIRLVDTDKSADWILWKSAPVPSAVNFDGTDSQALEVEFRSYLDASIDTGINLIARGDWTQAELKE